MKVRINDTNLKGKVLGRVVVNAELIRENAKTVIVQLPNGDQIKRHKARDVVQEAAV